MRIYVRLLGDLREIMGKEKLEIELSDNLSLKELIENKLLRYEGLKDYLIDPTTKRIRTDIIILLNERSIESSFESVMVKDGDIITFAPVIVGG
ncbi:MAG: MoaD/ThiS family protein [Nitrososphaerales archaeon]